MEYLYIFGTIFFTVYGQLIIKWRISPYGPLPDRLIEKVQFLLHVLLDPYIISGFVAAFIASFFWMAAMTKFDLSFAYPYYESRICLCSHTVCHSPQGTSYHS